MAIDDNTTYGLTGTQVKDLAQRIQAGGGGLTTLSYGNSTWNDFLTAYNAGKIVYCRASSNSDPSSGSQTRMAFMAFINNPTTPTEVEFQYVRSVSSKTASQQMDQVYVYKLTSASGGTWTVTTRDMASKIVAGTNMTSSYSNGTLTLSADLSSKQDVIDSTHKLSADLIDSSTSNDKTYQTGTGAPTTSTAGSVGEMYVDKSTGIVYACTDDTGGTYTWNKVSGPTAVQTIGTSTTDVMSQKAVTDTLFNNNNTTRIQIGMNASSTGGSYYSSVAIGRSAKATGGNTVSIGSSQASGYHSIALGDGQARSQGSIAIGYATYAGADGSIAIGGYSGSGNEAYTDKKGAIAIGVGAQATNNGEVNIGDRNGTYGYNTSNYRLLTGLYDPQSAHDAATKGYVDPSTDTTAPTTSTAGRLGEIRIDTSTNTAYMCVSADSATSTYTWKQITS